MVKPISPMFLRCRRNRSYRAACGDGLLSLRRLPDLVGRTDQCFQPVVPGFGAGDARQRRIKTFNKTEGSYRKFCNRCGGHIMTDHPGMKLVDVYAPLLQGFRISRRCISTTEANPFR